MSTVGNFHRVGFGGPTFKLQEVDCRCTASRRRCLREGETQREDMKGHFLKKHGASWPQKAGPATPEREGNETPALLAGQTVPPGRTRLPLLLVKSVKRKVRRRQGAREPRKLPDMARRCAEPRK